MPSCHYYHLMNRFTVCSDIHGNVESMRMIIGHAVAENADAIIFAGDLGTHQGMTMFDIIRLSPVPWLMVRGNCDPTWLFSDYSFPIPPRYRTIHFDNGLLFVTHGDAIYDWEEAPVKLSEHDIFIQGHTHVPYLSQVSHSPVILNPGSASRQRNELDPSIAVIRDGFVRIESLLSGKILNGFSVSLR